MSLLFALETKEPAPSARVPPSQGWAPHPAPPPLDPRLVPVSHDVVHWGTLGGGDKTVPYNLVDRLSTAPPPAPHRGLGERKLV